MLNIKFILENKDNSTNIAQDDIYQIFSTKSISIIINPIIVVHLSIHKPS